MTGADVDELQRLPTLVAPVHPPLREAAHRVQAALVVLRARTPPGYRPADVDADDALHRWRQGAVELDGWVAGVGAALERRDLTGVGLLTMTGVLAEVGLPMLPVGRTAADGGDGRDGGRPHPDVELFDVVVVDLDDQPGLFGDWWGSLTPAQRDRIARARWGRLLGLDGLDPVHRAAVEAAARADLPRRVSIEELGYEWGVGPFSIGAEYSVESVHEYDGDIVVTLSVGDTVAASLPERWTGSVVEAAVDGSTSYVLTMRFDDEQEMGEVLDDIGEALLPGDPDLPWWAKPFEGGLGGPPAVESSFVTQRQIARRLDDHFDHVVSEGRSFGVGGSLDVAEVVTGELGGTRTTGFENRTGNTFVTVERAIEGTGTLPFDVNVPGVGVDGEVSVTEARTAVVTPDGTPVSDTTTTTVAGGAGLVTVDLEVLAVTAGVALGSQVTHTATTLADGTRIESLVVADTERSGGSVAVDLSVIDPRLPRLSVAGHDTTATTVSVHVRENGGDWVEVTP